MIFRVLILMALVCSIGCVSNAYAEKTDSTPEYCHVYAEKNQYTSAFIEAKKQGKSFEESFEITKKKYHDLIIKTYDTAMNTVQKQISNSTKKQCDATTLFTQINRPSVWNQVYTAFQEYDCALITLQRAPELAGDETSLLQGVYSLGSVENTISQERSISKKVLFLSEEWYGYYFDYYPLHLDMTCLISEMQSYNKELWKFVDTIVDIPSKFYNYGSTHQ